MRHRFGSLRNDRGSVIVVVAITMVVLLGAAAIAIDEGNLWSLRRGLVTATDASALAGANYILRNGPLACLTAASVGAASSAGVYANAQLTTNISSATLDQFSVSPAAGGCSSEAGEVTIAAHRPATLQFAPAIGMNRSASVASRSIAEFGSLISTSGLRPIGLCQDGPNLQQWLNAPGNAAIGQDPDQNPAYRALAGSGPSYVAAGVYPGANNGSGQIDVVSHIDFPKVAGACGSSAGNWGWLNFAGGGVHNLNIWLNTGFNQQRPPAYIYPGETGVLAGGVDGALRAIKCAATTPTQQCTTFGIVIYSSVTGVGANARYSGVQQLCVALRNFQNVTGNSGSFDFEFLAANRCSLDGTIGSTNNQLALKGVVLCGGGYGATLDNKCDI